MNKGLDTGIQAESPRTAQAARAAVTPDKPRDLLRLPNLCAQCGKSADVCVLVEYVDKQPQFIRLCAACSDLLPEPAPSVSSLPLNRRISTVFLMAGLGVGLLAAFGDLVAITPTQGFGLLQQFGVLVGCFVIVLGALLRIDAVALAGTTLAAVAAVMDLVGPSGNEGIGPKQRLALAGALALLVIGLAIRSRLESVAAKRMRA